MIARSRTSASSTLALVALGIAIIAAIVLDVSAPGAGPLVQPISSFAHTRYAWLLQLSIAAAAVAVLLLVFTLRQHASTSFTVTLAIAGIGLAATGAFAADLWFPWERTPTRSGGVHLAAVLLVVIAFTVAMVRRARSVAGSGRAVALRRCELAYLTVLAVTLVYLLATAATGRPPLLIGLCERLLLGGALAWCALLAGVAQGGDATSDASRA